MGYSLGLLMRIGMRLLLGYFLIVAIAAWFVLSIFVQEIKPGVRRATEGTLIDTATLLAELAREDSPAIPSRAAGAGFSNAASQPINANIGGINKVRNEYHVYMTDAQGKVVFDSAGRRWGKTTRAGTMSGSPCAGNTARSTRSDPHDETAR
jgi:two-component system sensor histidine kinase CreC